MLPIRDEIRNKIYFSNNRRDRIQRVQTTILLTLKHEVNTSTSETRMTAVSKVGLYRLEPPGRGLARAH